MALRGRIRIVAIVAGLAGAGLLTAGGTAAASDGERTELRIVEGDYAGSAAADHDCPGYGGEAPATTAMDGR